ncbi:MAG: Telomeric repeat-binding factor 2 [Anaerocolumna sp.]|jgi:hypothetical protein|nr:Telomeric repeat-binding factor 2 [Anaerocolumna sp.]
MSATKKCKHCKTEIDKKAKVCPHCLRKQGGVLKFIIIAFVFIGVIGALASREDEPKLVSNTNNSGEQSTTDTDNSTTDKSTTDTETKEEEKTTFNLGETAQLKDFLVTFNGVTITEGGDFNKPSEGNVYALCEFTIENNSDSDIVVSSMISFEAYVDDFSISQSISGLLDKGDKNQLDGSVAAGKKMNGVIAYEVPKDWKELEISYTPDFWGKEITFIATNN